ncbi:hypothetical protein M9Y10_029390 [Tritrichomonas musculus]|uniref:Uncharacterized protein n=1 Tax=Tritrichomonas musculus TaxID=1915356 RepID=A0ABR2KMM4_9EUKA
MIFILFQSTLCHVVINFANKYWRPNLTLYMKPLDTVDIKYKRGLWSFFLDMKKNKDLYLDVTAGNKTKEIEEHGPFNSKSGIIGARFPDCNYTLKFSNEGIEKTKLAKITFSDFSYATNAFSDNFIYKQEPTPGTFILFVISTYTSFYIFSLFLSVCCNIY